MRAVENVTATPLSARGALGRELKQGKGNAKTVFVLIREACSGRGEGYFFLNPRNEISEGFVWLLIRLPRGTGGRLYYQVFIDNHTSQTHRGGKAKK